MPRISIELDLTQGQYEVLEDMTAWKQKPIGSYVKDTVLSLLECDVKEIFGYGDPVGEAALKKLEELGTVKKQKADHCMVCFETEGSLVPYGDGIFTSQWLAHPRCKILQQQFNQMFRHW